MEKLFLKIRRQSHPESEAYWEYFTVPFSKGMTLVQALQEIQKNPVNQDLKATSPVVWESSCHKGACGSCTMLIDGQVGLACQKKLEESGKPITLEPLSKFSVVRDLWVDSFRIQETIQKVQPFIPVQFNDSYPIARQNVSHQTELSQKLSACIQCGACLEACPQYNDKSDYVGANAINRARELHLHAGVNNMSRLDFLMEKGGVDDCGNAQNCQQVCPVQIPLVSSMTRIKREVTKRAISKFFGKED